MSYSERLTGTIIHEATHNEVATKDLILTPVTPLAVRLANAKDMRLHFERNMDLRNIPVQHKDVIVANAMFDNADSYSIWFDQLAKRKPADSMVFDTPESPTPVVGSTAETPDSR